MKNLKIILIGSVIAIGGYFVYKKFFSKIKTNENDIANQVEGLTNQAKDFLSKKDYQNAIQISEDGISLVDVYLKQLPTDSSIRTKLEGFKLLFNTIIVGSNKNI